MKNYFKCGVSDFILLFDNGVEINLNCITKETIQYYADGCFEIIIENASVVTELMDNIKTGAKLNKVIQTFNAQEETSAYSNIAKWEEISLSYDNLEISELIMIGEVDSLSTFNVVIKSNKKREQE